MERIRHLYTHFPFCPHVCPYCSFHVLPIKKTGVEGVLEVLIREFESVRSDLNLETLFFGGGTPSALSLSQWEKVFSSFRLEQFSLLREVTCECNPSTLSFQKGEAIRKGGVNRLSIGAQSFDPEVLRVLGRTHSSSAIEQCFSIGRESGFDNINLDLIFGIPGQSLESWKRTVEKALSLEPEHLSCYGLTYEEDTDFFRRNERGDLTGNPDLEREMFDWTDRRLAQAGFIHYEVSNFAQPGYESAHNLAYWRGRDYYGIGPSAVSTVRGIRKTNSKWDGNPWKTAQEEKLSLKTLAGERMALGLRTLEGVERKDFCEKYGLDPDQEWKDTLRILTENGLMKVGSSFQLTPRGREVADEIAVYFVE